jgi:regulator of CtrA degradation
MTREQVAAEKAKVRLDTLSASEAVEGWSEMPEKFRALVQHSLSLQALVRRMDEEIYGSRAIAERNGPHANPVSDQISLLNTVFSSR